MDTKHRRSPLVQGELEIPVKVVIETEATTRNREIINKYKQLVVTKDILQQLQQEGDIDSDEGSSHAETDLDVG